VLFYRLLQLLQLTEYVAFACLVIFAAGFPLVYYASETKQYSLEVLASVAAYILYYRYHQTDNRLKLLSYALAGALMVWFSYSAVFVLFSVAVIHLFELLLKRQWKKAFPFLAVYSVWGLSFAANYLLIIYPNGLKSADIVNMWLDGFAPLPPRSVGDLKWYGISLYTAFRYPLNLNWDFLSPWVPAMLQVSFVGLCFFFLGMVWLAKTDRQKLALFGLPILITLVVSGLHRYPFTERFLLFLVPHFIIFIGVGADLFYQYTIRYSKAATYVVIVLLIMPPVIDLIQEDHFGGWKRREVKKGIAFMERNRQRGEFVFTNGIASAFHYYNAVYNHNWPCEVVTQEQILNKTKEVTTRIDSLSDGHRSFWVLVAGDLDENSGNNHRADFLRFFQSNFRQVQQFRAKGVFVGAFMARKDSTEAR
ncbi:MAG: hypothetical protein MUD08_19760, partial [Cytophagales bacterium]|nr:hypothetical protein [Cytophagales bacterium]